MKLLLFAATLQTVVLATPTGGPSLIEKSGLFQGDIAAPFEEVASLFGDEVARQARHRGVLKDEKANLRKLGAPGPVNADILWQGGKLYYQVAGNTCKEVTNTNACCPSQQWDVCRFESAFDGCCTWSYRSMRELSSALKEITDKTGITFVNSPHPSGHVEVIEASGCSSFVGRRGYNQPLTLEPGCRSKGTIIHEFVHALGMWHEQNMHNRDKYVRIMYQNIEASAQFNFALRTDTQSLDVTYDYGSIMHYFPYAFSVNGERTIEAIDGAGNVNEENTSRMGSRQSLSASDAIQLQLMYHCAIENPDQDPNNDKYAVKTLKTLCSPDCPCNKGQGMCSTDADCKGDLECRQNTGVYRHLGQQLEFPGLNTCEVRDGSPTQSPTRSPTSSPKYCYINLEVEPFYQEGHCTNANNCDGTIGTESGTRCENNQVCCIRNPTPAPTLSPVPESQQCKAGGIQGHCVDLLQEPCGTYTSFPSDGCQGGESVECCIKNPDWGLCDVSDNPLVYDQGLCQDSSTTACEGGDYISGRCPGPAAIRCCPIKRNKPKRTTAPTSSAPVCEAFGELGSCVDNQQRGSCDGGEFFAGFCPGAANIQCCIKHPWPSCTAGDIIGLCKSDTTSSCPGSFISGKCPGPNDIKCCIPQTASGPVVGAAASGSFLAGVVASAGFLGAMAVKKRRQLSADPDSALIPAAEVGEDEFDVEKDPSMQSANPLFKHAV